MYQPHEMAKYTQTIRQQIADELFRCVWPFCGVALKELTEVNYQTSAK